MPSTDKSGTIIAAVIVGFCGVVAAIIGGIFLIDSVKIKENSSATATAISQITQPSLPTLTPPPTYTPLPTYTLSPTQTPYPTPVLPTSEPSTPLPSPTVFLPPSDGILFQDNFDNGMSPDWKIYSGKWIVSNGKLTKLQGDPYSSLYDWIGLDKPEWKNYIVSLTLYENNPTPEEDSIALAVRDNTTESKYIGLELNNVPYIYLSLISDNAGASSPIAGQNKDFSFPIKTDVQAEIEVKDNTYTIRVNGKDVQTVTIPGYDSGGIRIGLICSDYLGCPTFDNVKITYLP